jgi:hypothetical protein
LRRRRPIRRPLVHRWARDLPICSRRSSIGRFVRRHSRSELRVKLPDPIVLVVFRPHGRRRGNSYPDHHRGEYDPHHDSKVRA